MTYSMYNFIADGEYVYTVFCTPEEIGEHIKQFTDNNPEVKKLEVKEVL